MNHSEIVSFIQEQSQAFTGMALLELVGISPDSQRLNSPASHTALYKGRFGLAAKIHFDPHVNLPLLEQFAKATRDAGKQLDGINVVMPVNETEISCQIKVNPIIAVGLTHWQERPRPFILTPFISGDSLKIIGASNSESRDVIEKLCFNTTRTLNWDKPTSSAHILSSNIRFVPETKELVVTKIRGNFSRYSSR